MEKYRLSLPEVALCRAALAMVNQSDDPLKFRHVVADELSIALEISGDLEDPEK